MSKFKMGDKVRILDGSNIEKYTGGWNKMHMSQCVGEVYEITNVFEKWGDSPCAAYTLNMGGLCRYAKWDERGLELVTDRSQKIVIMTDGKITKARLYDGKQFIRQAVARCAPSDEFNFKYGASLALSRLNGDETTFGKRADKTYVDELAKSEYFTGKARCVKVDSRQSAWLTKGKIYEFVDGHSVDDKGNRLPFVTQIHSIKELNSCLWSEFEEVIEKKSQMDRFIKGEIFLKIPDGKTMEFLKECERIGLRWASGDKPTAFGKNEKYFRVLFGHLTCCHTCSENESWEIWDETKTTKKVEDRAFDDRAVEAMRAMASIAAFVKIMKDGLND